MFNSLVRASLFALFSIGASSLLASGSALGAEKAIPFEELRNSTAIVFQHDEPQELTAVLDADAVQTPLSHDLYAVVLHVQIDGLGALTDIAYVEASWEGRTFAQLKLNPIAGPRGEAFVEWGATDLVNGSSRGIEMSDRLDVVLANFPQYESVRPEENQISVGLTGPGAPGITGRVLADSFVQKTAGPPVASVKSARVDGQGAAVTVAVEMDWSGIPAKWAEVSAWGLDAEAQTVASSSAVKFGDDTQRASLVMNGDSVEQEVRSVLISVRHPGGDSLPYLVGEQATAGWIDTASDVLPWTWIALVAFPVSWICLSELLRRRKAPLALLGVALVVATALASGLVHSGTGTAAESASGGAQLPYLPDLTAAEYEVVEDWFKSQDETSEGVVLRREIVGLVAKGKVRVGIAVFVPQCERSMNEVASTIDRLSPLKLFLTGRGC